MPPLRSAAMPPLPACLLLCAALLAACPAQAAAAVPKTHTVSLGPVHRVPYLPPDAPSPQSAEDAASLKVRPLLLDGREKEWTTGDAHDVTDRSFTVRRALRLNDSLPGDTTAHWIWQPGPWLLIDRATGHITALHLPEFDPLISQVVWFRDYAAYCGIATTAKTGLFAIVAQIGARKPVVHKQIAAWPQPDHPTPVCQPAQWQRQPMRVTLQLTGGPPLVFDVVGTAALIEDSDSEDQ